MITIKIKTDNAAFADGNLDNEVSRILKDLSEKAQSNGVNMMHEMNIRDINGNKVGTVTATRLPK